MVIANNTLHKDEQHTLIFSCNNIKPEDLFDNYDQNRNDGNENLEISIPNNDDLMAFNEMRLPSIDDHEKTTLSGSTSDDSSNGHEYAYMVPATQEKNLK